MYVNGTSALYPPDAGSDPAWISAALQGTSAWAQPASVAGAQRAASA
jgi:hypothetical protein